MPGITLRSFLLLIAVCGLCGTLSSQVFQYDYDGIPNPIAQLSDIDGDGIPEYLTGVVRNQEPFMQIYSLALNQPLVEWGLGVNVSGPILEDLMLPFDLNQDGFLDIFFRQATSNQGCLVAYSGLDGTLIWERNDFLAPTSPFGIPTAIGDRNGDGIVDFVTALAGGEIVHLSGVDGSTLQRNPSGFLNAAEHYYPAGDLDGDGIPDYFAELFGSAWAFSGATDTVLFSLPIGIERSHHSLAGVGDVNGDGYDDFAYFPEESLEGRQPLEVWTGSPPRRLGIVPGHHHG
ncbi:MAG: VCBS repeat-containing protein, partial [Planctomycetota bacterium]